MGSITILLGRSRWRRRRALPARAFSGVDPLGRPTFLYVAASAAKRRVVEREFINHRAAQPCFAPNVRVLDELFDDMWARHGDGRAMLPRRAAEHMAVDLLAERGATWPWLHALGGGLPVARALVGLRDLLDGAGTFDGGRGVGEVPHQAELVDALSTLERRLRGVPGHVPRTVALKALAERVQHPTPALVRQLRGDRTVVIDDLLQPTPLVQALLVSLCRAWASAGTHVVLSFETGRDLGGREVGLFFEYDDIDDVAYSLRPFHATRALRQTVFEELVATGEASLALALREGVVEIEPGSPLIDPAPADLADHLYGPRPLTVRGEPVTRRDDIAQLMGDTVQIRRHADPPAELASVASAVKQALLDGALPMDCVVAVPDLAARAAAVRASFQDHGVPVRIGRPGSLAATPLATVALNIATLAPAGFPVDQVLALIRSDLVALPDGLPLALLARICSRAGVSDGPPGDWVPAVRAWVSRQRRGQAPEIESLVEALQAIDEVLRPLEALARPMSAGVWRERLLRHLRRLQLPERAAGGALAGRALDAWGALLELLEGLTRDLELSGSHDLQPEDLAQRFADALRRTPMPPTRRQGGQVEVVDLDDLLGLTPRHLWVLGLTRQAWPGSPPPAFLVPQQRLSELKAPRPATAARYLFASLLRNALDDREIDRLELSWPAIAEGRPTSPSPLLEDLLALPTRIPDPNGGHLLLRDALDLDADGGTATPGPHSISAALTLAAAEPAWRALTPSSAHADLALQARIQRERTGDQPGAWEGVLDRPPEDPPSTLGVTRLETFLKCPARFWYAHQLGLAELEGVDPEVPADRKGSALHAILEGFLAPRLGQPISGDADTLAAQLHAVAIKRLDKLQAEGGFAPALLDHLRDEWLAGLVDQRPAGVLRAWLDGELADPARRVPVSVEQRHTLQLGELTLSATLDRVDHTRQGALVVDYKSGRAPSTADVQAGLALQPIAYAVAQAAHEPERPVASAFVTLKYADRVTATGYVGQPEVLDDVRASSRSRLPLSPAEREQLLDHARDASRRLLGGLAHTTLATPKQAGCRYCDMRRICRLDEDRSAQLAASGADLQRPIDGELGADGDGDDDALGGAA